jgi:hypothetical protein
MSADLAPPRTGLSTTMQIIPVVFFTFICYLTIGIPLAVLPGYVHNDLGFSTVVAGAAKRTVSIGLTICGASGVMLLLATLVDHWPGLSLTLLIASRLLLGCGESLCGTGAILWGIGRVGTAHNAKVISWNGIATYGALALGAPLGVEMVHYLGFWMLGISVVALAALGFWLARPIAPVPLVHGERMSYRSVVKRVLPHGLGLAGLWLDRHLHHALLRGASLA